MPCGDPSLLAQRYCVHCGAVGSTPTICVAAGGKECTYGAAPTTVKLCSALAPGAADGVCFKTVQGIPLRFRAEPWFLGGVPLFSKYPACTDAG